MDKLKVGDILYHVSYTEVNNILLDKCADGKDFGKGFYLTSSLEQAKSFVKQSIHRAKRENDIDESVNYGYINVYKVISIDSIKEYDFSKFDKKWLHYVTSNRNNIFFQDEKQELEKFNVIGGKIVNDRTLTTLNAYMNYTFGIPGTNEADDICIKLLLPNRLDDQYCFKDELAIKSIEFVESIKVNI